MELKYYFILAYLLSAFTSLDALKLKSRELGLRPFSSEMQSNYLKRFQDLGETEIEIPALFELYELDKRGMMPYSGGIFGR